MSKIVVAGIAKTRILVGNRLNCFFSVRRRPHQKVKFQSFIKYFDWLESQAAAQEQHEQKQQQQQQSTTEPEAENQQKMDGIDVNVDDANACMKVSRKVFSGKQWLTIEDWLECAIPLCALDVKHEGRIERSDDNVVQTVFASARLGGDFLSNGWSQVCRSINDISSFLLSFSHSPTLFFSWCCCNVIENLHGHESQMTLFQRLVFFSLL